MAEAKKSNKKDLRRGGLSLEYIAGFLDGEGSINIRHNKWTNAVVISISQSQKQDSVIYKIKKFLDLRYKGEVVSRIKTYKKSNLGNCEMTILEIARKESVKQILTKLIPYLIVKKEKAKEALLFIKNNPNKQDFTTLVQLKQMKKLYQRGHGCYFIAKELKIGHTTVRNNLIKAGVNYRNKIEAVRLREQMYG